MGRQDEKANVPLSATSRKPKSQCEGGPANELGHPHLFFTTPTLFCSHYFAGGSVVPRLDTVHRRVERLREAGVKLRRRQKLGCSASSLGDGKGAMLGSTGFRVKGYVREWCLDLRGLGFRVRERCLDVRARGGRGMMIGLSSNGAPQKTNRLVYTMELSLQLRVPTHAHHASTLPHLNMVTRSLLLPRSL